MLEILGLTYNDLPPVVPIAGRLSCNGETIGRGEGNIIILPDPMRLVSRQHLKFIQDGKGVCMVRNISSANPIFINGAEIAPGMECALQDFDKILVGSYVLQVIYARQEQKDLPPQAAAHGLGNMGNDDFLAELLGTASAVADPAASGQEEQGVVAPFLYGVDAKPKDIVRELNERGLDPASLSGKGDELINGADVRKTTDELLQDPLNTAASQPLRHEKSLDPLAMFDEPEGYGAFGDILQSGKQGAGSNSPARMDLTHGPEINSLFHLPDAGGNPLPDSAAISPESLEEPEKPEIFSHFDENTGNITDFGDIDAFIAELGGSPALAVEAANLAPLLPDAGLPSVQPDALPASGISDDAPSAEAGADGLYQAFIEGLGMQLPDRTALDKAYMKMLGQVLRSYTQGTVDLIAGRTVVKQAVRANVTVIAPERNNPLKFSPDGKAAVMGMFGRPLPGFMDPVDAVYNAFVDLRAHQIGLISGVKAAFNDILNRFDPEKLSDRLPPRGVIESALPMTHKARLWDEYGRYFQSIREKSGDHFQEFFGEAFVKAYEAAISAVKSGDRADKP